MEVRRLMTKPWKWDVTIYDRPGWYTISDNHKQLYLSPSGRLGLRTWSSPAALTATDFWKEQFDNRVLVSDDGGMSWRTGAGSDVPPRRSVRTASGRIVSILSSEVLRDPEDRRRHLESVGLGHLYSDTTFYQYGLWPESMRDEVAGMGLLVHEAGNGVIGSAHGPDAAHLRGRWQDVEAPRADRVPLPREDDRLLPRPGHHPLGRYRGRQRRHPEPGTRTGGWPNRAPPTASEARTTAIHGT